MKKFPISFDAKIKKLSIFVLILKINTMKINFLLLFAATLIFAACKKNDSKPDSGNSATYINMNAGSSWTYHEDNSSGATPISFDYTVTSTDHDSTINGTKYHVYNYSYGGNQYLSLSGHNYTQYDSVPIVGNSFIERLYLKDDASVGTPWTQNFPLTIPDIPFPVTLDISNKITEKGISRTVNGIDYSNVIHVSTSLSSDLIKSGLTSSIDSYYAPNVGMIENSTVVKVDFMGFTENVNIKIKLTNSDLK
jgi:hypothetical protein